MSNNNIKFDNCNYKKNIYQSTQPLTYILNTPQDKFYKNRKKQISNSDNTLRGINCVRKYDVNKNLRFNNNTRINDDKCLRTTTDNQSSNIGSYVLSNYHQCKCSAPQVSKVALSEPSLYYRDGYGHTGINGCNIDADSLMRNGQLLTNTNCKNQLDERPYLTVPYMGRGAGNPCVESVLLSGEDTTQKKQCNKLNNSNINNIIPLVPCIEKNIQNPQNIIPEIVDHNWIRGGIPSRQLKQNANFLNKCKCI